MAGPYVAVVDGGGGLGPPARLPPVGVGPDLLQQTQLQGAALVVPPEETSLSERVARKRGRGEKVTYLMKGLRRRDV